LFRRGRTYRTDHITAAGGIDEGTYVKLGGQRQYLLIRGQDKNNPIIIWLHGGPAGPDAYTTYVFEQQLTDSYTFVNWNSAAAAVPISKTRIRIRITRQFHLNRHKKIWMNWSIICADVLTRKKLSS
jgi:hypothetical protein